MNTPIHTGDGMVWLEGVTGWAMWQQASSVHAAQAAVMQAVGVPISYELLAGLSGLAFRMQVSKGCL